MDGINRKKIQDVIIPHNEVSRKPDNTHLVPVSPAQIESRDRFEKYASFKKKPSESDVPKTTNNSRSHLIIILLSITSVLALGFLAANHFSSTKISIVPFTQKAHIDSEFTATSEDGPNGAAIAFQFMSLTEDESKEVLATIEKDIQKKASGKVIIYNSYNDQSQRLIKNTRLETPDKKIFHIDGSVVVPGAKVVGGKIINPGTVEAIVYADAPGEEYNIGLAEFTIPGFKGDPRYTKFTALSEPKSPLSGGFSGKIKVATDEDIAREQENLKDVLKRIVVEKARAKIPGDMIFFPGSMVLKFEEVDQDISMGGSAKVTMRATVSVFFFNADTLIKEIARTSLPDYQNTRLSLPNISTLIFTFVEPMDKATLSALKHIRFRIKGDPVFVGAIDTSKLIDSLAGKEKKDFAKIITAQSNIKKADATIFPLWKTVFPVKSEKFFIEIINE